MEDYQISVKCVGIIVVPKRQVSREGGGGPANPHHSITLQLHLIVPDTVTGEEGRKGGRVIFVQLYVG